MPSSGKLVLAAWLLFSLHTNHSHATSVSSTMCPLSKEVLCALRKTQEKVGRESDLDESLLNSMYRDRISTPRSFESGFRYLYDTTALSLMGCVSLSTLPMLSQYHPLCLLSDIACSAVFDRHFKHRCQQQFQTQAEIQMGQQASVMQLEKQQIWVKHAVAFCGTFC